MADHHHDVPSNDTHPMHLVLLLLGGLSSGVGAINLYWSFGREGGTFQSDFRTVGFSGFDEMGLLPHADFALPLLAFGLVCLIAANATAWRQTGGY